MLLKHEKRLPLFCDSLFYFIQAMRSIGDYIRAFFERSEEERGNGTERQRSTSVAKWE
jgi:hypothetical protein